MEYESIKSYFNAKNQSKDKCMAVCPCHDDSVARFSISCDLNNVIFIHGVRLKGHHRKKRQQNRIMKTKFMLYQNL